MPCVTLARRDGDHHRYSTTNRDAYTGVKAFWNDTNGAERQSVLAGSDDNAKQLRPTHASEADALDAARAEWRRIQRGLAEFELTMAHGRADVLPESPLRVSGFKPQTDATPWLVTEVEHSLGDSGFGTRVQCEVKGPPRALSRDASDAERLETRDRRHRVADHRGQPGSQRSFSRLITHSFQKK
ncbi:MULTISPECIES: contractile injection system protein, VgrG/Pvc8 family [unclassified Halomonas]|uniref:contractile injection system protein, VgrG/Pvc8 family n=1 Tax=unclassified Halomonas TaxID=2609666 RepID=UPI002887CEF5|nr:MULTISPECIES: contractile injection system protein, VgrG/Pvc8 family [unclassified Halomonas]MDT0501929.1 contractile injection system protein, VgrG/Pvc8 family [Halomonas sp. PAR7]MDT0510982.1 contractile injection system protein, VgrG/Pvc8 family [Halomonas sp. LES1]MDT0592501.1 contractile injection system protein, VgrG/Pvc8 family [Halomonas sp. PAR8]